MDFKDSVLRDLKLRCNRVAVFIIIEILFLCERPVPRPAVMLVNCSM